MRLFGWSFATAFFSYLFMRAGMLLAQSQQQEAAYWGQ